MQFPRLFEPARIGTLELKNRVLMAPMITLYVDKEGGVTERLLNYYGARAKGGSAMIIVEASYPRAYPGRIYLGDDRCLDGLKRLVEVIHQGGARACIEVNTHRGMEDEVDPASASEMVHPRKGTKVRALSVAELKGLQAEFAKSVSRIRRAGFDCLMIHGGYIISEFQNELLNKRTDGYGGSVENRARLGLEFLAAAREVLGPGYPIVFRLPCQRKDVSDTAKILFKLPYDESIAEGFRSEETVTISKLLVRAGVDAIGVTSAAAGMYRDIYGAPTMLMPRCLNVSTAKAVKKEVPVPVFVNGAINDPRMGEEIVGGGKADFIELGRPLVADPDLPNKARSGQVEDIRKCILCSRCVESIFRPPVGPMYCSVNPAAGKEKEFEAGLKRVEARKRVLVIGGGPAGMQAATVASSRGHDVALWEKKERLGGQLNLAVIPPGKEELKSLVLYLQSQMEKAGVRVSLNTTADAESVLRHAPDAVIIAAGSGPAIPKIQGMEKRKVLTYEDVLLGRAELGGNVVVVGGGFVGCETAEFLREQGREVTILELLPALASDLFAPYAYQAIQRLKERKVGFYTSVKDEEITPEGVVFVDRSGKKVLLPASDIVIAAGNRAEKSLSRALEGKISRVYEVGDCTSPARIYEAISQGAEAGLAV